MEPTEDAFRALACSSPWLWRTLHFLYADDHTEVKAWLRCPGQLLVRQPRRRDFRVDERDRRDRRAPASRRLFVAGRGTGSREPSVSPRPKFPREVRPVLRQDGLVAERPRDVEYDDPMYQSYDWVAMLDPVELSHHTTVSDLREEDRLGRRTWWVQLQVQDGYEPRCGCCPLLWSFISDRDGNAYQGDLEPWRPSPGTVYPKGYEVALDVETGVAVERTQSEPALSPPGTASE